MKICNKCKINKTEDTFYKIKKGKSLHSKCKECCAVINKANNLVRDKSKKLEYNKLYYELNKSEISTKDRAKKNEYQRTYYQINKESIFEKEKDRYNNDYQFRLSKIYRSRLNSYIKGETDNIKYLNCDLDELMTFIEIQFEDDMSWESKGQIWELDHVIPVSKFNLELQEHKNVCFHWCNLKPIYKAENRRKSNKLVEKIIEEHQKFCLNYFENTNLHYINIYEFYTTNLKHSIKNTPKGGV